MWIRAEEGCEGMEMMASLLGVCGVDEGGGPSCDEVDEDEEEGWEGEG